MVPMGFYGGEWRTLQAEESVGLRGERLNSPRARGVMAAVVPTALPVAFSLTQQKPEADYTTQSAPRRRAGRERQTGSGGRGPEVASRNPRSGRSGERIRQ